MASPTADTLLNRFMIKAKFRHMQVLTKLAELGSMRRTAEAVGMTQPAVSQMVSELEKLLDTKLFFRHARGVEPTETTRDLLPVAERILEALEDGSEAVANRLVENEGVVRVAASPAGIGGVLYRALGTFAATYPTIQVHVSGGGDKDPMASVAGSRADVICTRDPAVLPEGWVFEHCVDDMLIAVCGKDHQFATAKSLSNQELGKASWLLNRVGSVARNRFEEMSRRHEWPPSARCQIILHIPELTFEMLSTGKYLAILPRSVARPWLKEGTVMELKTDVTSPLPSLGVLWRKERAGLATTRFVNHLKMCSQTENPAKSA